MNRTLDFFKRICLIPRESGNEEGMRQYLLSWAKENGFEAVRDNGGNIIIYCPASKGLENVPSLALQGHMDMVCVKTATSSHDFTKDPIEVYQDGTWLKAKDTSLGADNGIAVAMAMSLVTDPDLQHGPIECIFTSSEETSMEGAFKLEGKYVNSRLLVNLDSEEDGTIFIGCAGGIDVHGKKSVSFQDIPEGWERVKLSVGGLKGGHSGGEIHKQRLNALGALARMLLAIEDEGEPFMLASFEGGTKRNVIPSEATAIVSFPAENKKRIMQHVLANFAQIKAENLIEEPDFFEDHKCTHCIPELKNISKALSQKDSLDILHALMTAPHGVFTMSKAIEGIVETSDNMAIAKLSDNDFQLWFSVRSNVESHKDYLAKKIAILLNAFGFETEIGNGYPAWTPNPNSKLAKFCADAWKEVSGQEAILTAIHAGLECGVINDRVPGMDSVSIGPMMEDIHSVKEKVSITSVNTMYEYVKHIIMNVK